MRPPALASIALCVVLALGCTATDDDLMDMSVDGSVSTGDGGGPGDGGTTGDAGGPDADGGPVDGGSTCAANAAIRCDGNDLERCNAMGDGFVQEPCEFGCNTTRVECNACAPSLDYCVDAWSIATCNADGTMPSGDTACMYGCNTTRVECNACMPSTTQCQARVGRPECADLVVCNPDGTALNRTACRLGCVSGPSGALCLENGPLPDAAMIPTDMGPGGGC